MRILSAILISLLVIELNAQSSIGIRFEDEKMALTRNDSVFTSFVFTEVGPVSEGILWVNAGTLYAYIDTNGNWLSTYKFTEAGNFHSGFAIVQVDSTNYGMISNNSEWAIEPDYRELRNPVDGLVCANLRGKWGILDTAGNILIDFEFEENPIIRDGEFIIVKREKWGVINRKNETVVPCRYDLVTVHGEFFLNSKRTLISNP